MPEMQMKIGFDDKTRFRSHINTNMRCVASFAG